MSASEAEFSLLAQHLRNEAPAHAEPPADLWQRIENAHALRLLRRRRRRYAGGAVVAALVCAMTFMDLHLHQQASIASEDIDWQARAQALELQLHALDRSREATIASTDASEVESELAQVDYRLQTAYEHREYTNELMPLWKRRSELLNTLIAARTHRLTLTHI